MTNIDTNIPETPKAEELKEELLWNIDGENHALKKIPRFIEKAPDEITEKYCDKVNKDYIKYWAEVGIDFGKAMKTIVGTETVGTINV